MDEPLYHMPIHQVLTFPVFILTEPDVDVSKGFTIIAAKMDDMVFFPVFTERQRAENFALRIGGHITSFDTVATFAAYLKRGTNLPPMIVNPKEGTMGEDGEITVIEIREFFAYAAAPRLDTPSTN